MARRAKPRRRARKTFSLLGAVEAATYANIVTEGFFGGNLVEVFTGSGDLNPNSNPGQAGYDYSLVGGDVISLSDIIKEPGKAFEYISYNMNKNLADVFVKTTLASIGFNVTKRLLRRPMSNIQRNIVKPILGPGVRLA